MLQFILQLFYKSYYKKSNIFFCIAFEVQQIHSHSCSESSNKTDYSVEILTTCFGCQEFWGVKNVGGVKNCGGSNKFGGQIISGQQILGSTFFWGYQFSGANNFGGSQILAVKIFGYQHLQSQQKRSCLAPFKKITQTQPIQAVNIGCEIKVN